MKIFYAVQATGNGHISRATQLYPYLKKYGEVDFFLSGSNATLEAEIPVKYRSKGCSLFYSKCGGLDYWNIAKKFKPYQIYKDANELPLQNYDVIINDFDAVTALACKLQKVHSVQFGHQASFISEKTPRPESRSKVGEFIFKNYAPAPQNLGLHFQSYDSFIHPPVIKDEIVQATPTNLGHITVYLPSFDRQCLEKAFFSLPHIHFHWFLDTVKERYTRRNITYFPVNQKQYNNSLITCDGIITGGGFETPSEALYLEKMILSIPIKAHYEQECNSAALKSMGVPVEYEVKDDFNLVIENWLNSNVIYPKVKANTIPDTLEYLFDTYNSN
ncbi:Glycosyl transferase [Flavobacterium sp. 9AF]|uniref:glycosyltransferase family protein n=1 Tax=Flavobacterium sp. 9AF TaxID=2653142 RepID=UPI0012F21138|nr:glycosyltransferase family protein [Flavobacterium sp. 9AF]VXB84526.1 Glycosyl transferase [Flavobacterium sp. 9AF]